MARKDRNGQGKKDQLNAYKKEIGKQYMDGLISDKEYEKLLREKEAELGQDEPAGRPAGKGGKECPSCGALVGANDNSCNICGGALQPSLDDSIVETEAAEPARRERSCQSCGATVSGSDTICSVCGSTLPDELDLGEAEHAGPPAPEPEEKTCPSCGAEVDASSTECPICETPLSIAEVLESKETTPAAVPDTPAARPVKQQPPIEASTPEIVCGECGATLEEGTEECFICGAKVGKTSAPPQIAVETKMGETMKAPEPVKKPEAAKAPEPPEQLKPEQAENVCAGCGATLDQGTEECFICGAKAGAPATPEPIPADDDVSRPEPPKEVPAPELAPAEEPAKPEPEIVLREGEILCPSCSSVIKEGNDKCPECWTDLSLYIKCPECGRMTPAGEQSCRECFTALETVVAQAAEEPVVDEILEEIGPVLELPEQAEVSQELMDEMAALEAEEEQGKECLVCGAIFGTNDDFCPVCAMEYGVDVEEPEMPQVTWDGMDVEVHPIIHTCPSCGNNVTGLEATEREVNEGKWFYRGLVLIFSGIFFTSFSIYARGVSAENSALGLHPPPTDALLNLLGWILVLMGFVFWYLSWRLHNQRTECPSCGIETEPDMTVCVNCGAALAEHQQEEPGEEQPPPEENLPDDQILEEELPPEPEVPAIETSFDEELEVPKEEMPPEPVAPPKKASAKEQPKPQPQRLEPAPQPPKQHFVGEELPVEHEEHKKCPGCGIFVDLSETMCPICDTVFDGPAPAPVAEVPSEEDELSGMKPVPASDLAVPKAGPVECPSCGAEVEAGTRACPVCEYPIA
jgi:predicted amidophosphoribosyltransferase